MIVKIINKFKDVLFGTKVWCDMRLLRVCMINLILSILVVASFLTFHCPPLYFLPL